MDLHPQVVTPAHSRSKMNRVVTEPDDTTLVRAAQTGEEPALGALLERHRARLHAVAVGMLGHGPDAEDAVQDTMLIALRRIGELREPAAVGGWLAAVLVNVCRAQLRRPVRERPTDELVEPRGAVDTVVETLDRIALRDWVSSALERLPEPQRVAIVLRHFSAASSYEAIAEICAVPVGTVRSRLNAARAQLVDELLATAAHAHSDHAALRERTLAIGASLAAFERSGKAAALQTAFTPDLSFRMFDRVERRGRGLFAMLLAGDFDDGVTARPRRAIPGEHVSIFELLLDNPADQPLHCPPAVTQVHYHDAGRTHRLVSYYALRP
jgi:RNA polymerase sigma-70 factor (ECF subfamily)